MNSKKEEQNNDFPLPLSPEPRCFGGSEEPVTKLRVEKKDIEDKEENKMETTDSQGRQIHWVNEPITAEEMLIRTIKKNKPDPCPLLYLPRVPAIIKKQINFIHRDVDSVARFTYDWLVKSPNKKDQISMNQMWEYYETYCGIKGYEERNKDQFFLLLKKKDYEMPNLNAGRFPATKESPIEFEFDEENILGVVFTGAFNPVYEREFF